MATAAAYAASARIADRYHDASPTPGKPLTKSTVPAGWFMSAAAEGYTQTLLERWEALYPEAAEDLAYIANEAKWSAGWKGFGRMLEDL